MNIIYWQSAIKNFGDELNVDFYARTLNLDLKNFRAGEAILGVGSILDYDTTRYSKIHVLGSGSGFDSIHLKNVINYKFWFVRGPLTAKVFGLDENISIGDPAILVPQIYDFKFLDVKKSGVLFIPHYYSAMNGDWAKSCASVGIKYRSPMSSLQDICTDIAASELIITESLHGAILADTYRVPWILVATPPIARSPFKWHDWAASIGLQYQAINIPCLWTKPMSDYEKLTNRAKYSLGHLKLGPNRWKNKVFKVHAEQDIMECGLLLEKISKSVAPTLSKISLLEESQERMMTRLEDFKKYVLG